MTNSLSTDESLTLWFYHHIGLNRHRTISKFPILFGLIPYELYILPGMFLAIACTFYYDSLVPLQIHLLPLWSAYSISSYLKSCVRRLRPGCNPALKMNRLIDAKQCDETTKYQSFPSRHTIIAFSLATSLILYCKNKLAENKRKHGYLYIGCIALSILVACSVSIHRISYGYHHVGDVLAGAVIGAFIGYLSFHVLQPYVHKSSSSTKTPEILKAIIIVVCIIGIGHFFMYKFRHFAEIRQLK